MARILIIDDSRGTLETVSVVLATAGFETATAESGAEGLALAKAEMFHAILIDLRLPDMSGLDVIRQLDSLGVRARKVIVTAFPAEDTAFAAGAVGADGYVEGPLFDDDLISVAQQALDGPYPVLLRRRPVHASDSRGGVETSASVPIALDGYARWVEAIIAVVMAPHDVPGLQFWPSVLPTTRSLAALRHWCRAVSLSPAESLDLARSLRAFVQGRLSGRDPRRFLAVATKDTADRFWRKAGVDNAGRLSGTLSEWLERQTFIQDPDALEALAQKLRGQLSELQLSDQP